MKGEAARRSLWPGRGPFTSQTRNFISKAVVIAFVDSASARGNTSPYWLMSCEVGFGMRARGDLPSESVLGALAEATVIRGLLVGVIETVWTRCCSRKRDEIIRAQRLEVAESFCLVMIGFAVREEPGVRSVSADQQFFSMKVWLR